MRFALLSGAAATLAALASCSSNPSTGTGGSGGNGGATTSTSSSTSTSSTSATSSGMGGYVPLPDTFTISGVVTDGQSPVEGAVVMQGGLQPAFTTGPDGKFTLEVQNLPGIPTVVAAKVGYRSAGYEVFELPQGDIELVLVYAAPPDDTAYVYGDPGNGNPAHDMNTSYCGHCHTSYVLDFQPSGHNRSARDVAVQDLYAGVSSAQTDQASCVAAGGQWRAGLVPGSDAMTASKCYLGAGVLPDLNPSCGGAGQLACDDPALAAGSKPKAFGRCADCHAAGIDGPAGGRDLLEAKGFAYDDGTHCDVCHHVKDVDLTQPPGAGGALVIQRPREKIGELGNMQVLQVLYGPEPDVPNGFMGGSWQPKFKESVFCGGCHEQKQEALVHGTSLDPVRWPDGLPTHSTYSEWLEGPFGGSATTCQVCHMPPDDHGLVNSVDTSTAEMSGMTYGFPRTPKQLRKHTFRGPLSGTPRFIAGKVTLDVAAVPANGALAVTTQLKQTSGHAMPTGEPMRSLLLVLHAEGCGSELTASDGMTLDDWGGALAEGVVGAGVTVNGDQITWAAASAAKVGAVVRVVRPTGTYDDYPGIGFFANPTLTAPEKGVPIPAPMGEATITGVSGSTLTLSKPIAAQDGDVVYLGEALPWPPADDAGSLAIAGHAGYSFARTLVDASGARGVPHFRAVDMVSDNRLAPGVTRSTTHTFAVPPGCPSAKVDAVLLYRPFPVALARERGWSEARDYVVSTASVSATLP